jgi:hypothetical protein
MAQQTAVEWLQIQLKNGVDFNPLDPLSYPKAVDNLFEKAKTMEKEQISKAWDDGDYAYFYSKETGREFENGEEYYNEIYMANKNNNDK